MRGALVLVILLLTMYSHSAPIRRRRDTEGSDASPQTTIRPPPLLPTIAANKDGILIWMCQNSDVLRIVDEIKQSDFDVTNVGNLTKEVLTRLTDFKPSRDWIVYSIIFTTRSTADLITDDGETVTPSLCFLQFNENPQILVVADLAQAV